MVPKNGVHCNRIPMHIYSSEAEVRRPVGAIAVIA
jgi:hypothetical protein